MNLSNVGKLSLLRTISLPDVAGTPVIVNGIIYATGGTYGPLSGELIGSIHAIDEGTGTILWTDGPKAQTGLGFSDITGVAVDNGEVFAATHDNYIVALNAITGALIWKVSLNQGLQVSPDAVYVGHQGTPLVWNGEVIVSNTLSTSQARGFVRAFRETDGALLWTFYTIPLTPITPSTNQAFYQNSWGSCTYCGGGDMWNVPALDSHTGIIYFGTGDPTPYYNASERAPSHSYLDLYTDCVIALNATNGQMVWYYKQTPWDTHDWDTGMPVHLFNTTINGAMKEVVGSGTKSGFYYLLDAKTGSLIYSVSLGIHKNTSQDPTATGEVTTPGASGGVETYYSYNPITNMVYITAWNYPEVFTAARTDSTPEGGSDNYVVGPYNSTIYAIDASTGGIVWTMYLNGLSGGTSTTNGLVFTADQQGNYYALNAQTGATLWRYASGKSSQYFAANWGPPSVTDGMLFATSFTNNGGVLIFSLPSTSTSASSTTSTTTTTITTSSPSTVSLTINSVNLLGNTITGYYNVLYDSTGSTTLGTGFTPTTYTVKNGQTFQIEADSYTVCTFDHWSGGGLTGQTLDPIPTTVHGSTVVTAVYRGSNCGAQTTSRSTTTSTATSTVTTTTTTITTSTRTTSSTTTTSTIPPTTSTTTTTATSTTTITTPISTTSTTTQTSTVTSSTTTIVASTTTSPTTTTIASTTTGTGSSAALLLNGMQSTSGSVSSAPYQITLPNFNAGTGSSRLLLVGVEANNNNAISVTFGGVQLSKSVQSFYNNDAEFWYLVSPSGTGNIVVTLAGPTSAVVGAYSFSGVDQANPIPSTAIGHNTSPNSPAISIATKYPNSWVIDSPSIWGGVTLGGPTCAQEWNVNVPNAITGASSSRVRASPGSVTCSWTASGGGELWDNVAIEVKASGT